MSDYRILETTKGFEVWQRVWKFSDFFSYQDKTLLSIHKTLQAARAAKRDLQLIEGVEYE